MAMRAVLRGTLGPSVERPAEVYEKGRLRIDFDAYEVLVDGRPVHLSLRDFQLLRFFVRHPDRVFNRRMILQHVWGNDTHVEPRTVDVHVRNLRRTLEPDDSHPELMRTVRDVGYRFSEAALGC